MIDMHSRILPGLDDGAADWEQAIAMARVAVNDGIAEMVCTPHWVLGKYENGREAIHRQFAEFEARLAEKNVPLKIYAGAELRLDTSIPERLRTGELLTLDDGGRYILLELPEETLPENLPEFFWNLQMNKYQLILSHVERNPLIRENPQLLFTWVENGILAQVTAASLLADFSEEIREFAFSLVEHNLVHMLVTDTHSLRMRKPQLAADRVVCDTPRHILRGEPVPVLDPIPFEKPRKRGFWSFS